MRSLILAGGKGTRLQPISESIPKHLIPICNKPVIEYAIEYMANVGIDSIGIVVSEPTPNSFSERLGNGEDLGVDITYIVQEEPLGLAHAVSIGREFVGDESVMVYFGDSLLSPKILETLVENFEPPAFASIALTNVDQPSRFGIAQFDDGRITRMHEKPEDPPTTLAYVGALILDPEVFEMIGNQTPSDRGELELTDTLDRLASTGREIVWEQVDGMWIDVGTPDDVISANKRFHKNHFSEYEIRGEVKEGASIEGPIDLDSESVIAKGAQVTGPVHIDSDVTIGPGAIIGQYTSIGPNTTIENASVRNSVIMSDTKITTPVIMKNSITGPEIEIIKSHESSD